MSFQGNSCLNAFHPSPQHVWLCLHPEGNKIFQAGSHTSANARALLDKCEKSSQFKGSESVPRRRGDRVSTAGTRSQTGMHARAYCSQAALQMPWLSQNNISCTSKWECVGACWCATSELEERYGSVLVPSAGDCPGSGWLKDKPGHLYACITYWMLKGH